MKRFDLLRKPICRKAELCRAAKLHELLPDGPNDLWQMDVTQVHIPGFGWRHAIAVIDYYSRYLLAAHLTDSYSAAEAGGDPVTPADVYVGGVRTQISKWPSWAKAAKAKLDEMMEQAA